jgi:hypothetical protein
MAINQGSEVNVVEGAGNQLLQAGHQDIIKTVCKEDVEAGTESTSQLFVWYTVQHAF